MGVGHGLDAVEQVEFLEDVGDVRLGRGLADHQPLADLGIEESMHQQLKDGARALSALRPRMAARSSRSACAPAVDGRR